ncbi:MAG: PEP-CTERM sorting domain-containing protein, partial [Planctomycetales bacterium]|nr:PEP-CTERM sorting domain-containing protein [Planctomycetales bacterium]
TGKTDGDSFSLTEVWEDSAGVGSAYGDGIDQDVALYVGGPTYQTNEVNGLPIIRAGAGAGFRGLTPLGISGAADFTVVVVAKSDITANQRIAQIGDITAVGGSNIGETAAIEIGTAAVRYNNGNEEFANDGFGTADYHIGAFRMSSPNQYNSIDYWLDGTLATATAAASGGNTINLDDIGVNLLQGTSGTGADNEGFDGDAAEILIFSKALSEYELNIVGGYLEAKYGLDTAFVSPVPEPSTALLLVFGLIGLVMRRRR